MLVAALLDPDLYRRYWRLVFGGTVGLIAVVFLVGRAARGSTRWINVGFFTFQPSEFGKLLFVLALAGFLAERADGRSLGRHDAADARARRGAGGARVRAAGPRHGARLPRRARRDALRRRGAVAAPRGARRHDGARPRRRPLGRARRRRQLPQVVPVSASDLFHASVDLPAGRALQRRAVDRRGRLRRAARPGPERRHPDAARLPAGAPHRLRLRLVRRAARLRRRLAPARALPARALARACASSRSRATCTRRSWREGSSSRSCSRSSSTSA